MDGQYPYCSRDDNKKILSKQEVQSNHQVLKTAGMVTHKQAKQKAYDQALPLSLPILDKVLYSSKQEYTFYEQN